MGGNLRFQRLRQHVARLRQRAFAGVYQQHHAVDNLECAFYFAAKIAMARRVDDVDFGAVIPDTGGLGKNGDPALAFKIV